MQKTWKQSFAESCHIKKNRNHPPRGGLERKRKRTRQRRKKKIPKNSQEKTDITKRNESMNFMSEPYSESISEIIILAKHTTLTDDQIKILRKGLSFIPNPKRVDLHRDIREFMTKARMQFLMHQ